MTAPFIPKPIPTLYRGVTFRSRLEARWALFFDELELDWYYEHEGYQLPSGWYLPDFWLPLVGWIEIKPEPKPTDDARRKCLELASQVGLRTYLLGGALAVPKSGCAEAWTDDASYATAIAFDPAGGADSPYLWCTCQGCSRVGLQFDGRGARICGATCPASPGNASDKDYSSDDPRLISAFNVAARHRFT